MSNEDVGNFFDSENCLFSLCFFSLFFNILLSKKGQNQEPSVIQPVFMEEENREACYLKGVVKKRVSQSCKLQIQVAMSIAVPFIKQRESKGTENGKKFLGYVIVFHV